MMEKPGEDCKVDSEIESKKYAFDLVNQWINNADNKISIAFALISVIFTGFGAFFSLSLKDYDWKNISGLMVSILVFISLGIIAFIISLICYGIALFPNLIGKQENEKKFNLLFYGDVSRYKKDEIEKYRSNFKGYDKKRLLKDVEDEIFYNSRVCHKKMILFRAGLISTGALTILFIVSFLLIMFIS